DGCYINNLKVSDLTLKDIGIRRKTIEMKIGVKEDAKYKNGMNLYGDKNGKHGRDVTLLLYY
ncbi:MAG: transcriptional regulator, partial [Planctomycetota bacterium]|nr:transcriptional regulator [Planctomycetota bacterium]